MSQRLIDALRGMVGLVQLVQQRYPDFPVDNHRVLEAMSALNEASVVPSERAPTVLDAVAWRYRISDGQPWYYSGHNPRGDVPEGWIVEPLFPAPEAPK